MKVPTLETKRLILKELTLDYVKDYQKQFATYGVIRNIGAMVPWPYPNNGAEVFLKDNVLPKQGKHFWQWGLFLKTDPDTLIGSITLEENDTNNRGFWLGETYWGQGLMTEATDITTDFAFSELDFSVLRFFNAKGNERSRRLKERVGAKFVKLVPLKCTDPTYTESECWELTKEDWLAFKARS